MGKVKNKLKKNLSDRSKEKPKKSTNPFEVHVNRQKFTVIGRNLKHDKGLPGIARSKAFTKRKATLLREYQLKNKSNKFMDRRIGEKSKYMTPEDRVTARFTAEQIKAHKKSMYNLADEEILTHRGHALSEIEKFDDPKSDDDDDDKGKLEGKFVKEAHFGGFLTKKEETESQAKSRKELIDQLIAESKKRRYEKQKLQDETLELTDKLDTQWKDLLPLVSLGGSEPVADEKNGDAPKPDLPKERPKVDPYDLAVQELKFEARGKPSEKLKTEEEIAKEEKEKLEKLESERQKRMHGFVEDNLSSIKHRSADDLDDGFALESDIEDSVADGNEESKVLKEEEETASDGQEEVVDGENGGSDTDDNGDDGDGSAGEADKEGVEGEEGETEDDDDDHSDDEFSDLVLESSDDDKNEEEDVDSKLSDGKNPDSSTKVKKKGKEINKLGVDCALEPEEVKKEKPSSVDPSKTGDDLSEVTSKVREELLKRKAIMEKARKELPYTFTVPDVYNDFQELMKDLSPEHQSVVLERMIKCTHPSLKSGNRQLLEALFVYILQHINDCLVFELHPNSSKEFSSEAKYCFSVLRNIMSHIYDLVQSSPENAASSVVEVIKEKFEEVGKEFPGLDSLLFLKMIPEIFPSSDFRHFVCTPAIVWMTHILRSCQVKSRRDVAAGLFVTSLLHEYSSFSKRFSPEAVNFLLNVIYMAIPKAPGLPDPPITPMYKNISEDNANLLVVTKNPFINMEPPDLILEAEDLDESNKKVDGSFRTRALNVAVQLILSWINQLKDLPAKKDIFYPFTSLISMLPVSAYPLSLANSVEVLKETLKDMVSNCRPIERLAHAAKKPKPLKLYEPAIEEVFDGRKRRIMSKEKAEHEKLLHKYKKEMKGAIREIRRDRDFLAKVKVKETLRNDMQRMEKVKEIFGTAALQQGELNKLKRKR